MTRRMYNEPSIEFYRRDRDELDDDAGGGDLLPERRDDDDDRGGDDP